MLTDAERAALERTRKIIASPPQEVRRADAKLLVAALDRLAASNLDSGPDLPTVVTSLRTLIGQLDAGELQDHVAVRQRLTGAVIAMELLAAGDDEESVLARLTDTARVGQ